MNQNLSENDVAKPFTTSILPAVKWDWKWIRTAALLAVVVMGGAGCGGIRARHSISPASFFLPGLLKNEAPTKQDSIPASPPGEMLALK